MATGTNTMVILKSVAIKLSPDVVFIHTLQYHTEPRSQNILENVEARKKSRYRFLGRVDTLENFNKSIVELRSDTKCLEDWKWPNDPSWTGKIAYIDSNNGRAAKWLSCKLKKAVDFDTGLKMLNGYKRIGKDSEWQLSSNAKYDLEGYTSTDGTQVDLTNKDTLLKLVGQNIVKEVLMKSKLPAQVVNHV